jgi:hypothetical protein
MKKSRKQLKTNAQMTIFQQWASTEVINHSSTPVARHNGVKNNSQAGSGHRKRKIQKKAKTSGTIFNIASEMINPLFDPIVKVKETHVTKSMSSGMEIISVLKRTSPDCSKIGIAAVLALGVISSSPRSTPTVCSFRRRFRSAILLCPWKFWCEEKP